MITRLSNLKLIQFSISDKYLTFFDHLEQLWIKKKRVLLDVLSFIDSSNILKYSSMDVH